MAHLFRRVDFVTQEKPANFQQVAEAGLRKSIIVMFGSLRIQNNRVVWIECAPITGGALDLCWLQNEVGRCRRKLLITRIGSVKIAPSNPACLKRARSCPLCNNVRIHPQTGAPLLLFPMSNKVFPYTGLECGKFFAPFTVSVVHFIDVRF